MTTISSALPLVGRTALVTGVSRRIGIGYAIAHRLGQLGASLFVQALPSYDQAQYRTTREEFTDVLASLRDIAPRVEAIEADFLNPEAPARVVEAAHNALGHLDILVANHAYGVDDTLDTLTAESVDRHMQANVRGTLLLAQAYTRQHDGRPGGRVVMMTSGQNSGAMPWVISYGASKAAIFGLTATLAKELAGRGITVNTVNPGATDTGYADVQLYQQVVEANPQGRWGTPDDAARVVTWLCTDDARWITGQVINSTGGGL